MVGKENLRPRERDSATHLIALESGRSGLEFGNVWNGSDECGGGDRCHCFWTKRYLRRIL